MTAADPGHPLRPPHGGNHPDVRFGLRALRRSAGFAIIALLTIAIGIGANAAMRGGMGLTGIGLGVSMTGAVALAKWLASLLFRVAAYDPVTLALVALVLLLTALAPGLIPARRPARVNPIMARRAD